MFRIRPGETVDVLPRVTTLGRSTLYSKAPTGATKQKCASSYLSPLPGLVIQRATYRWLSPTAIHLSFLRDSIRRSSGTHSLLPPFDFRFAEQKQDKHEIQTSSIPRSPGRSLQFNGFRGRASEPDGSVQREVSKYSGIARKD